MEEKTMPTPEDMARIADDLDRREKALARREFRQAAHEAMSRRGYGESPELLDTLNVKSIPELERTLDVISAYVDRQAAIRFNNAFKQKEPQGQAPGTITDTNNVRKAMGLKG